ncbi:propionyl-CoA carboxylase alpha chain [Tamaricihabitans halophyticus]|uniref:Propionyl-CoA carboxylase alpha chain n=1 Tax=Tamaricihabitans halophyticus TaxID=1262583 RepID=A0A4R2PZC3_9PSEU|nr:biotin carboxylase N-terminal domain-containing protein [Tamaricihabitans halophyticus]TCP41642.1 propionyl-CoA carboxylase alpha chain [Tamaricihabitans halophyticus]
MITRLLVANRGEIARRVFHTCRELGIECVAVYSDADAEQDHAREADLAVRLPGTAAADTYLSADALIAAARSSGADAIHPGYGFLSEDADFAAKVSAAGLVWIGPAAQAIEAMAAKVPAKQLMAEAGVPVLGELDPERLTSADLPVLLKASAGGGGRGMRVVRALDELDSALESARLEAAAAFGDATVFCEPYLEAGRHIEVQVLADTHGTVWAVGERECSIQRRHQKVIEEAPAPLVQRQPMLREQLCAAARDAAKAIEYVGAGTVEFLADEQGRFFFLEMNTRLQVEHPVTECTTGLDLVRWQLRIAEGWSLPATPPESTGHAIEARLYAEDPAREWQPSSGPLYLFDVDGREREFQVLADPAIRLDSGVRTGSEVSVHYDPMLAKVISYAPTRTEAARALSAALGRARVHGLRTNRDLLVRTLRHPAFLAGDTDTAFFDRHGLAALAAPLADTTIERLSALAAALADAAENRRGATVLRAIPSGWRNIVSQDQLKCYASDRAEHAVRYRFTRDGPHAPDYPDVLVGSAGPDLVELLVDGVRHGFAVARYPDRVCVDSAMGAVDLVPVPRFTDPAKVRAPGSLLAPMPGNVVRIAVSVGDQVAAGQPLLWLEAMKMEHTIAAPASGVVGELLVASGQQVAQDATLIVIAEPEADQPQVEEGRST